MPDLVKTTIPEDGVGVLTLDTPENYNALSSSMIGALTGGLKDLSADASVRVIIIRGAGKGFCAGHDLKEIGSNRDRAFYAKLVGNCCEMMQLIQSVPQPVIAQVHGAASAAGCQLVATCDMAVAADDARFSTPGILIGLFCSTPMVPLSRSIARKRAMEMLLTGDTVSAEKAAQMGLINSHASATELEDAVMTLARKIAAKPPCIIGMGKKAFYEQADLPAAEAYRRTADVMVENLLADEAHEGIGGFLQRKRL
ncbi:MAG: enoyl-CoA hydratase [Proteobacteria bacterium]|nr:enoyl-CoA hydratase [Pseudomonadota bacterium]